MTPPKQPPDMGRKRDDSGQYVETVGPDDVLDVLAAVEGPAVTSSDVAEHLECSTEVARQKLRRLVDEGVLARRKTGRTALYWRPGADESEPSGEVGGSPDTTLDADEEALDTQETPTVDEGLPDEKVHKQTAHEDDPVDAVREYLDENDHPPKTDHGREVMIDALRYLRAHETAKTGEIREALAPDHADHYPGQKAMDESIRRYLEDIPGIEKVGDDEYRYTGDETVRDQLVGEESGMYDPTEEF